MHKRSHVFLKSILHYSVPYFTCITANDSEMVRSLAQTIDDCWDDTVHLSNHRFSEPNRWPFQRLWEYKYGLTRYRSPIININKTVSWLSYLYDRSSYTGKPTSLYWDTPRTPNQGPWRHHQGITVPCGNWYLPRIISHNWFLFSPRLRTELIRQPGRHMLVYAITRQLLRVG